MSGRVIICPECLREARHYARGLCDACYGRKFRRVSKGKRPKLGEALRLAQLIGSTEAAARLGVSVVEFRSWAQGVKAPTVRQLTRLRELLRDVLRAERNG